MVTTLVLSANAWSNPTVSRSSLDDPVGRCCYGGGCNSGVLESDCATIFFGIWTEGATCEDYTCPPMPLGRCCYDWGCLDQMLLEDCRLTYYGVWTPDATCNGYTCPPMPLGRCCDQVFPYCSVETESGCLSQSFRNGVWTEGATCDDPDPCPAVPIGRCCFMNDESGEYTGCLDSVAFMDCMFMGGGWTEGYTCDIPCGITCSFDFISTPQDFGDLAACNYPTKLRNPGHKLSNVAWLGATITAEANPAAPNADAGDDGVYFVDTPWYPCSRESLYVEVTAGPSYAAYELCGRHLYLNAWKDGNLDGDFCDEITCQDDPPVIASEWIIQDLPVVPGLYAISVIDPGVLNLGTYDGVFRFRLTSRTIGRNGFGASTTACTNQCGTFGVDYVGEVEDYIIADGQLAVELTNFELVPGDGSMTVNWSTASETDNHHFVLQRDGVVIAEIATQGNSSSGYRYTWTDSELVNGTIYSYSLASVDVNGVQENLATESATPQAEQAGVITEYVLHQNFPNPFNPLTTIRFDLLEAGVVTLKVYNIQGQEVATLINGTRSAGSYTVTFAATGKSSGLYLCRMEVNGFTAQQKMLFLK